MPLPENLAANPDEFLDYYHLLDQPEDATTAMLRGRINDLYSEAQANRDHRNAQKRREYLLWLDLLPSARTIMTDETKRAKYNDYRQKLQAGENVPAYAEFVRELEGKPAPSQEQAEVLGLRDDTAKVADSPTSRPSNLPTASDGGASSTAGIAALVVLVIAAGVGFAMKQPAIGLIAGAILGGIIYMVMRGGNKVAR